MCREIIRNTFEHRKCDSIAICGQYWPKKKMVEITFIDRGIGLYNSLISNLNYRNMIINDEDSINFALLPGITETFKMC